MSKIIDMHRAVELVPDGATIMFGGFLGCGNPHGFVEALSASGKGGFTMICNDAAMATGPGGEEGYGVAKLINNKQVKKLVASHIGTNPEVAVQMNSGALEVELVPQGSLAEMIRAGGAGLGGVLTPTGLGTTVEQAEHVAGKILIEGDWYLIEKPLRADFAVLSGHTVDRLGNVWYKGTTRNFNAPMAMAADTVIVEADNIVEVGGIEPENVVTPGSFVDYIVGEEGK